MKSPMSPLRRRLATAGLSTLLLIPAAVQAAWPERPITVIVPSSAGSSLDRNVRRAFEEVGKVLGQSVVIQNKAGAGGLLALQTLANAKPDGYTIGIGNTAGLSINPVIQAKPGYDPMTSFEYVARFTSQPNLLVIRNELPIRTVAELTKYAKANPRKLSMGSQGNGSTGHLSGEIYRRATGTDFVHVPYRGGVQATQDLIGGSVDFLFENVATIEGQVESGKVRPLAVTSARRNTRFPDVPTMQEAGIANYDVTSWSGVLAPAKTPRDIVLRLNRAVNFALEHPGVKAQIVERGGVTEGGTPEAFRSFAAAEAAKWRGVIKGVQGLGDSAAR